MGPVQKNQASSVDQVAGPFSFVSLNKRLWIKVSQSPQPQAVQRAGQGGERIREQPGDVTQIESLMPQLHDALEALRIERQPLVAANTASIRQGGRSS